MSADLPFVPISDGFISQHALSPYRPVRTRAGHEAYIWEYDPEKPFAIRVRVVFDAKRHKDICVSETGQYISKNVTHAWDVFNISSEAWNRSIPGFVAFIQD